jgi:2-keto-4-pentenoate hydratase/2-oxohepta-3-ene-1,7-dioic acid hydratase in catechol pathway
LQGLKAQGWSVVKLFLGRTEGSRPHDSRIFAEVEGRLIDLAGAYAAYLGEVRGEREASYELASLYFPTTVAEFLENGERSLQALADLLSFVEARGVQEVRAPDGEKVVYHPREIVLLPPLDNPGKTIVIGFSDNIPAEMRLKAEVPTGFHKLPRTFTVPGGRIVWPSFSQEIDCDACLAVVIGKPGRRVAPEKIWDHVAGFTLLLDITARDVSRREAVTKNHLLGKNFPSSTSLGPALLLKNPNFDVNNVEITLTVDGVIRQSFTPRQWIFSIEQTLAHWSSVGLSAGDVFALGGSVALRADSPQSPVALTPGCLVRGAASGIGELCYEVVREDQPRS